MAVKLDPWHLFGCETEPGDMGIGVPQVRLVAGRGRAYLWFGSATKCLGTLGGNVSGSRKLRALAKAILDELPPEQSRKPKRKAK